MSSVVVYLLVLLLPVAAIAYVIWAYRKKAAQKEAVSRERMAELMIPRLAGGAVARTTGQERPAPGAAARPAGVTPAATTPATATPTPAARHERLLTRPETLMYYMLKAGLTDHEVFAKVSLDAVVETPANPFPQQPGERLPAQHELDFVVCDKKMRVVAVVQLHGPAPGPWAELVYRRLSAVGIKVVTVDPGALPRREQVRTLVFGPSAQANSG